MVKASNIRSIPPCKNATPGWNNQESQKKSMSVILQNSFSLSNISWDVDNGDGGSLVVAAAAWQCQRRWGQHGVSGGGGSLGVTRRWRRQHDYETDNEAELMEKNFGDEEEDDDTFGASQIRGRLA